MKLPDLAEPFFLPSFREQAAGVDFLGLRQANLDLMDWCLPGINNATPHIRPFSLLSWINFELLELMRKNEQQEVTGEQARALAERIEILFTWGHRLEGYSGVPGNSSPPPKSKSPEVPLTFKAWKRTYESTSLMAAVNYGPSVKVGNGLGLLAPIRGNLYRVCGAGAELAAAMNDQVMATAWGESLATLDEVLGTEIMARELMAAWRIDEPTRREQEAFLQAFFDESKVGEPSRIGRRSATIQLIRTVAAACEEPSEEDIRQSMTYGRLPDGEIPELSVPLQQAQTRWEVLQVRQAQRLALEGLLSWVEMGILDGLATSDDLLSAALDALEVKPSEPLARYEQSTLGPNSGEWRMESAEGERLNLFDAMDDIAESLKVEPQFKECIDLLLACGRLVDLLRQRPMSEKLAQGGPPRVSLLHWSEIYRRHQELPVREFLGTVLENLVLSQHLATAAGRYDGQKQRLRFSIEERGLVPLIDRPWHPAVTPDRLRTAMSLMRECELV